MTNANGHIKDEHKLVPCPRCGSTARRCKRPSGHEAATWHEEREDLLAKLRADTCKDCAEWMRVRMGSAVVQAALPFAAGGGA